MTENSQNDDARPETGKQEPKVVEMGPYREEKKTCDGGEDIDLIKAANFIAALFVRYPDDAEVTLMAHEWSAGLHVISKFPLHSKFLVEVFVTEQPRKRFEFFFQFGGQRPDGTYEPTHFGGFDTGTVHPKTYDPAPDAYWETSPGRFQAVWDWGKAIPVEASEARLEALIHEYGGVLGTHRLDGYLRIPWSINHKACHSALEVKMLQDSITQKAKAWVAAHDR